MKKRGFTLIELLIVIAIIAILAIIIIVAINPGKMLAKSRDSQRFSDVTSLATAVNLFLADNQTFAAMNADPIVASTDGTTDNERKQVDGSGWIPLNFKEVSSGSPIAALPLDPYQNEDSNYHYVFGVSVDNKTYEIMCRFEHDENTPKHEADGGDSAGYYEVGTDLTMLGDGDY